MIVFVHLPSDSERPDVVWWQGPDGGLREIVTGEDTAEVKTARASLHKRTPEGTWNQVFEYLAEYTYVGSQNWDTHVLGPETTPQEYVAFLMNRPITPTEVTGGG